MRHGICPVSTIHELNLEEIEDEIEVEVAGLGADAHLAGDEGEAMAHFQEEVLELGDDGGLDFGLGGGWIFRQAEELEDVGVLDEVADGGFGRECFRCADGGGLGGEQALVGAGLDLAFQGAGAPVLLLRVRDVILWLRDFRPA